MINLLPPKEKQKLTLKERERLIIVLGSAFIIFLICLILVLLSIKFYILSEIDYQKSMLNQVQQSNKMPDFESFNEEIKKYNAVLGQLGSFYSKEIYFTKVFEIINSISYPKGVYSTNFSLNRSKPGAVSVGISGISNTRENLLIFRKNMEANKDIENLYFSPESWINQKEADFFLTFEIKTTGY